MDNLRVFDEITAYFNTQKDEIEKHPVWNPMQYNMFTDELVKLENPQFWDPDNQEIKFNNLGRNLEQVEGRYDHFEGMKDFQMYKTLCFMRDYEKKQLKKMVHLREIFIIKCKLSMLCTSTRHYGIPFETIMTQSLPFIATEDYDVFLGNAKYTKTYDTIVNEDHFWCSPFYDDDCEIHEDDTYYNKIDVSIHIQHHIIFNIDNNPKVLFEDKMGYNEENVKDIPDDMDYKKIEIELNKEMLGL